jgi:hypothetical protein
MKKGRRRSRREEERRGGRGMDGAEMEWRGAAGERRNRGRRRG